MDYIEKYIREIFTKENFTTRQNIDRSKRIKGEKVLKHQK